MEYQLTNTEFARLTSQLEKLVLDNAYSNKEVTSIHVNIHRDKNTADVHAVVTVKSTEHVGVYLYESGVVELAMQVMRDDNS